MCCLKLAISYTRLYISLYLCHKSNLWKIKKQTESDAWWGLLADSRFPYVFVCLGYDSGTAVDGPIIHTRLSNCKIRRRRLRPKSSFADE